MAFIIGLKLAQKMEITCELQKVLSKYGCNIKTRIGLHDVSENQCAPNGTILLDVIGDKKEINSLIEELNNLENAQVKTMEI